MIKSDGIYSQLYAFAGNQDAGSPTQTLLLASDGNYYETCQYGGTYNKGVLFKMTPPR